MAPDEAPSPYDFAATQQIPCMPWEDPSLGFVSRLWGTLASAFHPVRDVARVSHGGIGPAMTFALLTAVPAMMAAGVIPFTRHLMFGSELQVMVSDGVGQNALVLDGLAAAGLGLATLLGAWLVASWNFAGLARFASDPGLAPVEPARAAWRLALYRAWLLPFGALCYHLAFWVGPELNQTRASLLELVFMVLPCVIQMLHFSASARYAGTSTWAAIPVSFLPLLAYWFAVGLAYGALMQSGYLPMPEAPK